MNFSGLEKEVNVLVVDSDNNALEDLRSPLSEILPNWHFSATDSGKQCLNIINSNVGLDLLIIGTNPSDTSGLDLLKQIRDDSDIPIVIISDTTDIQKLLDAFDNGASDYVFKPFNKKILATRLKALLKREQRLKK